jgi:hypothetical protein
MSSKSKFVKYRQKKKATQELLSEHSSQTPDRSERQRSRAPDRNKGQRSRSPSLDRSVRKHSRSHTPDRSVRQRSRSHTPDRSVRQRSRSHTPDRSVRQRSRSHTPDQFEETWNMYVNDSDTSVEELIDSDTSDVDNSMFKQNVCYIIKSFNFEFFRPKIWH